MFKTLTTCGLWLIALQEVSAQLPPVPLQPVDERRVAEIMTYLPDEPAGFGAPCRQRETWDQLRRSGKYDRFLREMENFRFPEFSDDAYFSLSRGTAASSAEGLQMMRNRARGLSEVTWAECLENKGRYVPVIEAGLSDMLRQKSWVSPRNDFDFKNYNGVAYSVELTTALYGHTVAQTLFLLGDKLNPSLRKKAIETLYQRVFNPVLHKIETQNKDRENRFLEMTNNYNHVCLSGVAGAALTVLKNKRERAVFAHIAELYSKNGLRGFGSDGYCSEGIGYFNYGFGHYVLLRESLRLATGGKIDLFEEPVVREIAMYAPRLEIMNGVYPAISDAKTGSRVDPAVMAYLNSALDLGLEDYQNLTFEGATDDNRMDILMAFLRPGALRSGKNAPAREERLRSYFGTSGVLVCRPPQGKSSASGIGVAFKGGNNKENHNHNDVGSYTVVVGKEVMAGDPGSIPYTANIFTEKFRYTYKSIGSYGHPVPLVAGTPQQPGARARAVVVSSDFGPEHDRLVLDLTAAYGLPELQKLERTLDYYRNESGSVVFTDDFEFTRPDHFETALITRAAWRQVSDTTLELTGSSAKTLVHFSSPQHKLLLKAEEISEGGVPYTRIGISTGQPARNGSIIIRYTPVH